MKSATLKKCIFILQINALLLCIYGLPQQQDTNLEANINDIFNLTPSAPTTPKSVTSRPRQSLGTIVTPEPIDPSKPQPEIKTVSGKQCNCVPYHMCDPQTNMPSTASNDDTFDGFGLIDLRFGEDDPICEHYLDVCCGMNETHQESLMPRPLEERPNRQTGCGIRNVGGIDFNITGALDNESGFGEFPWTIALLDAGTFRYFCTGSLIHPNVVLTAVHCLADKQATNILVRAGEWDAQTTRERLPFQERNVDRIIRHPQFNIRNVAYNFALLILKEPITLDDHINVVCLPGQNAEPNSRTQCFSTGWGKDRFGAAGRYATIMKRVRLPIFEFGACQTALRGTRLGPKFALDRSFICAGGERDIDTCQGDGGAPLVCPIGIPSENRFHQSGIVSWGIGCNDDLPAAYANVALVRDWIDQQMIANGYGTTSYSAF